MCNPTLIRDRATAVDPANRGKGLFMTTEAAADVLGVSPQMVRRLCTTGAIRCARVGKFWRISRDRLMEYAGLEVAE